MAGKFWGTVLLLLGAMTVSAVAGVPQVIAYQGFLEDTSGVPLNGQHLIKFIIYDSATGGTDLWNSNFQPTTVTDGLFEVQLGQSPMPPLPGGLFVVDTLHYLGISVGVEPEMIPRSRFTTSAYSFNSAHADDADLLDGLNSTEFAPVAHNHTITTTEIANNTILFEDIAPNGATSGQVMKWDGNVWLPANDSSGGIARWTLTDTVLYTNDNWGIARGNAGNALLGDSVFTMVNLGVACTTGRAGFSSPFAFATIGGGYGNSALGKSSTIAGGRFNLANSHYGTVGGGLSNQVFSQSGTIGGGEQNTATHWYGVIGGGIQNTASGHSSAIVGGRENTASGAHSFIGGGFLNVAADTGAVVAGGEENKALRKYSFVGGGYRNVDSSRYSSILGGERNTITSYFSSSAIVCGTSNKITSSGGNSVIAGGSANVVSGASSFAFGYQARARHHACFVVSVKNGGTQADSVSTSGNEQIVMRANGGFYLANVSGVASIPAGRFLNTSMGAYLSTGGVWTDFSDKNSKENFSTVDGEELLEKVAQLPISQWNYKTEGEKVRHIGPVGQDFYSLFGVGQDEKSIATLDEAGIALVAIKQLHKTQKELETKVERIEKLEKQIEQLQKQMKKILR